MKTNKIIKIIVFSLILIIAFTSVVFASDDLIKNVEISNSTKNEFNDMGNTIYSVVRIIGIVSSVIALMLLGIKYMVGSVEQRADYKKTFPLYLTGCILAFGIFTIGDVIYELFKGL